MVLHMQMVDPFYHRKAVGGGRSSSSKVLVCCFKNIGYSLMPRGDVVRVISPFHTEVSFTLPFGCIDPAPIPRLHRYVNILEAARGEISGTDMPLEIASEA